MMTLEEWESLLKRELRKAKFVMTKANPALAWQIFSRLLQEEVEHDAGTFVLGRVEGSGKTRRYSLQFCRHAESDISYSLVSIFSLDRRPVAPLKDLEFEIWQRPNHDSFDLLPLDEFLDRAYAEEKFQTVLGHKGTWKAQLYQEDLSD